MDEELGGGGGRRAQRGALMAFGRLLSVAERRMGGEAVAERWDSSSSAKSGAGGAVLLRRTCQTALSVTQKDRSREHAGTSHMCRSSEPQLRIEESSNGQTGDGPRSRNPGGLSQKPDNKHKSALQAGPDTGQVHDGEEAQCTLTGNGRSVDHVQVMIMSNGSHHSSGWTC